MTEFFSDGDLDEATVFVVEGHFELLLFNFVHNSPGNSMDRDGLRTAAIRGLCNAIGQLIRKVFKKKPKIPNPAQACLDWVKKPTLVNCNACCLLEYSIGRTSPKRNEDLAVKTYNTCLVNCRNSGGKTGPTWGRRQSLNVTLKGD
jgi:hypothetical protein